MFIGKVIGTVWSTVKWPALGGHKLLVVRPYHLSDLQARLAADSQKSAAAPPAAQIPETVVCIDLLDAGVGDEVVVAFGHAARVAAEVPPAPGLAPSTPIDAAVVAIVDGYSLS